MDRLLFGDNQFFGINHMSEEKARAQAMRFQDVSEVVAVLDAAYDEGIRTRADPARYAGFRFYPCMPYAHKYANAVTDHGMIGAAMHFIPDEGLLKTALRGGVSLARKDVEGLAKILVDMEMKIFAGLRPWSSFCRTWWWTCCSAWASRAPFASSTTMYAKSTTPSRKNIRDTQSIVDAAYV